MTTKQNRCVILSFLNLLLIMCVLLCGCSRHLQHPSLQPDAPRALINEKDLSANDIISSIKGFCTNKSDCADSLNTSLKGRTIEVPPGKLGMLINHKYEKILKKEKILSVEQTGGKIKFSWSCLNGDSFTMDIGSSKEIRFISPNLTMLMEFSQGKSGNLYKITSETCEWDTELWANVEKEKEYILKLSSNKLISPDGVIVGGKDLPSVQVPDTVIPTVNTKIISGKLMFFGNIIGEEFVVDQNCMFSVIKLGKPFIGTVLIDSEQ